MQYRQKPPRLCPSNAPITDFAAKSAGQEGAQSSGLCSGACVPHKHSGVLAPLFELADGDPPVAHLPPKQRVRVYVRLAWSALCRLPTASLQRPDMGRYLQLGCLMHDEHQRPAVCRAGLRRRQVRQAMFKRPSNAGAWRIIKGGLPSRRKRREKGSTTRGHGYTRIRDSQV